jgi:hypothetical protein
VLKSGRSPRYPCEGSTELREQGCDLRDLGSFGDVSLYGCYVEAQATLSRRDHAAHEIGSQRWAAGPQGEPARQLSLSRQVVAFVEMSEENVGRLLTLLATISRPTAIMGPGLAPRSRPAAPLDAVPRIADPGAALPALTDFFESRQRLMREDFLRTSHSKQE